MPDFNSSNDDKAKPTQGTEVDILVWGCEPGAGNYTSQAKALIKGLDVGHAAIRSTFPMNDENAKMIADLKIDYPNADFETLITENAEEGKYEFYWSFWPYEGDDVPPEPHELASLKDDIYWQRYGVPFHYDKETELAKDVEQSADKRNARGLLGQRTPYYLGPEMVAHFPKGFAFEECSFYFSKDATSNLPQLLYPMNESIEHIPTNIYNVMSKHLNEFDNKVSIALDAYSSSNNQSVEGGSQALGDLIYLYVTLNNNIRELKNEQFKLNRGITRCENEEIKGHRLAQSRTAQIECEKHMKGIENVLPANVMMKHITHGLLPTTISLPMAQDNPSLDLKKLLATAGKLSQDKVKYSKLGKWNCSSTTAHLLHESLKDKKAKEVFKPNRALPYTPQKIMNQGVKATARTQPKMENSSFRLPTLDSLTKPFFLYLVKKLMEHLKVTHSSEKSTTPLLHTFKRQRTNGYKDASPAVKEPRESTSKSPTKKR